MDDTPEHIKDKVVEIIMKKSPEDRIKMGWEMFGLSKTLVTESILRDNPNLTKTELKQQVFLRFYGNDFDEEQLQKILKHFEGLN